MPFFMCVIKNIHIISFTNTTIDKFNIFHYNYGIYYFNNEDEYSFVVGLYDILYSSIVLLNIILKFFLP